MIFSSIWDRHRKAGDAQPAQVPLLAEAEAEDDLGQEWDHETDDGGPPPLHEATLSLQGQAGAQHKVFIASIQHNYTQNSALINVIGDINRVFQEDCVIVINLQWDAIVTFF